jgi:hypothetical protein
MAATYMLLAHTGLRCHGLIVVQEVCEISELPVDQCRCRLHGGTSGSSGSETVHPPADYDGPRPPKDAILVHKSGKAHWYGCLHLPDYPYLIPPTWGWIEDRGAWQKIGAHQLSATGGNTSLVARERCLTCDS